MDLRGPRRREYVPGNEGRWRSFTNLPMVGHGGESVSTYKSDASRPKNLQVVHQYSSARYQMKINEPEVKVLMALEACHSLLKEAESREVQELVDHNECGVAKEFLADFLGEEDAVVSRDQFRLIQEAFDSMMMAPGRRLEYLREIMERK